MSVIGMIGAAGDLCPMDMFNLLPRRKDPDATLRKAVKGLIRAIEEALETASENIQSDPIFKHRVISVDLPLRKVAKSEVEAAEKEWREFQDWLSKQESKIAAFQAFLKLGFDDKFTLWNNRSILIRAERMKSNPFYTMKLHALRIGDAAIVTNPFELFVEFGLQIKARSRAKQTFIAQLATGTGGYLPTEEAIASGGYSTRVHSVQVGPEGGHQLVEHSLQAIHSLWEEN